MTKYDSTASAHRSTVWCGRWSFDADTSWSQPPQGFTWTEVSAVAADSQDRIFVFARAETPVFIFDTSGKLIGSWGKGIFARPHGLTIGPDDRVYCTDDLDHTVRVFTRDGEPLLTLGQSGRPSHTGATSIDYRTIKHSGPPFHFPTNVAISPEGDIFVSDGYGNARIHRFSHDGVLKVSWGEPGSEPGQFHVPHGIAINQEGLVFVADRENSRIQVFSPDGDFVEEVRDIARPCQVAFDRQGNLIVAELGYRAGLWPGMSPPSAGATGGRISMLDSGFRVVGRMGGEASPNEPGNFYAPHDVCIDSHGNLYVAEVTFSAGGNRGLAPPNCHTLQQLRLIDRPAALDSRGIEGHRPTATGAYR